MKNKHPRAADIYIIAWDATIGAGRVGEDFPSKPTPTAIAVMKKMMGAAGSDADDAELLRAWAQCESEQANP